jgi:hypothetical protein
VGVDLVDESRDVFTSKYYSSQLSSTNQFSETSLLPLIKIQYHFPRHTTPPSPLVLKRVLVLHVPQELHVHHESFVAFQFVANELALRFRADCK